MKQNDMLTPMMQQYMKIKDDYPDAIVFFRLGDFYEMFFDDALVASKVLEIALTARGGANKVPMCGVPHHAVKPYIQKLIEKGFKVAIADQVSAPGKGLVDREVVRVITPGMIIDDEFIDAKKNIFVAAVEFIESGYLLAYCDITTGDSFVQANLTLDDLLGLIAQLSIKEVVMKNKTDKAVIEYLSANNILLSIHDKRLTDSKLVNDLAKEFKVAPLLLLSYLAENQKTILSHFSIFTLIKKDEYMHFDVRADRHLEITQSLFNHHHNTLIFLLDKCQSAIGARKLRSIVSNPLKDFEQLNYRYDLIEMFMQHPQASSIAKTLSYVYDISRILGRINFNNVNARDLHFLRSTLAQLPTLKDQLLDGKNEIANKLAIDLNPHAQLLELLQTAIVDNPPITIKEGGIIKKGYNQQLDELLDVSHTGSNWLKEYEEAERNKTQIKNLKVGYNRIFGYYIEISKGQLHLVNDDFGYERKQTLANCERFVTDELKHKEGLLLSASDKSIELEYQLFLGIKDEVAKYTASLQKLANQIALIDCFLALAKVATDNKYVRPRLTTARFVEIINGRHPVVEKNVEFIANHVQMNPHEIFLITGPNMAGKSTYMRMFALIVFMAQIGSFVPADFASLPIYDAIYTRIGSSDDLSGGKSTFMLEMLEANVALSNATENSLILFDELGRGTATYDGLALAQGIIEHIHNKIKAQTFFSTHYHELTVLEKKFSNISNLHVEAKEKSNEMIFLHQVKRGSTDKSYGVQVAALALIPPPIIKRSKQILKNLEKQIPQVESLFENLEEEVEIAIKQDSEVISAIESIDINEITPVDALVRLKHLQDLIKKKDKDAKDN